MTDCELPAAVSTSGEQTLAEQAVEALRATDDTLATCESLTAGMLAGTIAQVPGASAVLRGGLVVYATDLKHRLAGVDAALLTERGPIDPEVAAQMAVGAAKQCQASMGAACTGVAGPDEQEGKPVGLVYTAVSRGDEVIVAEHRFPGSRAEIRKATVDALLSAVCAACAQQPG